MNMISEKLKEFDCDICNDIFKIEELDLAIISQPNLSDDNKVYFKVLSSFDGDIYMDMCRINMIKPEYLNLEGETLILSKEQIKSMIYMFNQPCKWDKEINYWQYMINCMNFVYEVEDNNRQLPLDLPIPDYLQLLK